MNVLKSLTKKKTNNNNNCEPEVVDTIVGYTYAAKVADIQVNVPFKTTVNGVTIGIYKTMFNGKKKIYAMSNKCSHQGFPLTSGEIEEINGKVCVGCKAHGMKFDLATGLSIDKPDSYFQKTYQTKVVNSIVYVAI